MLGDALLLYAWVHVYAVHNTPRVMGGGVKEKRRVTQYGEENGDVGCVWRRWRIRVGGRGKGICAVPHTYIYTHVYVRVRYCQCMDTVATIASHGKSECDHFTIVL